MKRKFYGIAYTHNVGYVRNQLKKLGYTAHPMYEGDLPFIYISGSIDDFSWYEEANYHAPVLTMHGMVDCTDNDTLFFAIAALRDDTDFMQWFVDGDEWKLSETDAMYQPSYLDDYHKATVKELVEHFNKK